MNINLHLLQVNHKIGNQLESIPSNNQYREKKLKIENESEI